MTPSLARPSAISIASRKTWLKVTLSWKEISCTSTQSANVHRNNDFPDPCWIAEKESLNGEKKIDNPF